jgi:hypothetical protein
MWRLCRKRVCANVSGKRRFPARLRNAAPSFAGSGPTSTFALDADQAPEMESFS